jgi:hypothetical protein
VQELAAAADGEPIAAADCVILSAVNARPSCTCSLEDAHIGKNKTTQSEPVA